MNNWIINLRIILWLLLTCLVGWLLYMGIVPTGRVIYINNFKEGNYFIKKLFPEERLEPILDGRQKVIGDPIYFTLRTPRRFDKAKLTLKYKNSSQLPLIEAGILSDKTIWRYNLKSIENKTLDDLILVWDSIKKDNTILLQKNKNYSSLEDFFNNLPELNKIAVYNYKFDYEYIILDYIASGELREITQSLRGNYEFYTYIKDETLDFTFSFSDINKNKDDDPIDLSIYYNNQLIDSRHLDDDGIVDDKGEITERGEMKIKISNLPEGIYKIGLKANDDIITEKIITSQSVISFNNKVWLADQGAKNIILYTDSRNIQAKTINPKKLQTIKIGDSKLDIDETYKQFNLIAEKGLKKVELAEDDIILAGEGIFSFNESSFINPNLKKVTPDLDISNSEVEYIISNYVPPLKDLDWRIAQAEFDLTGAYREKGAYNFLISIPGLRAEDNIEDFIEIDEIRVDLLGKSLKDKIKELFEK